MCNLAGIFVHGAYASNMANVCIPVLCGHIIGFSKLHIRYIC